MEKNIETPKTTRSKKGEGSVSKRSNGTFMGRITLSGYKPFCCYGKSEREVKKKMKDFKEKSIRGEVDIRRIFVSDYMEEWLRIYKYPELKPSSYDRLERTFIKHIKNSHVGHCQLGNITTLDLQNLINEKQSILSFSSIKKVYQALNACFTHAEIVRELNFNPMNGVKLPRESTLAVKTKKIDVLTPEDVGKLQSVSNQCYSNGCKKFVHGNAIIFMLNTGLRCGEALCLKWSSVNLETTYPMIHIFESMSVVKNRKTKDSSDKKQLVISGDVKTNSGHRDIPLNKIAIDALKEIKQYQQQYNIHTDYVIATKSGKMVLPGAFQRSFDSMLKVCKIKHVGLHALRHTFATILLSKGVDIKTISKLLGHSSVNITYNTYVHPSTEVAVSAVSVLEEIK